MANTNELEKQIEKRRLEIATDSYSMSVGELTNLYRDNELNVHPEFQRFFRWKNDQKSRLIESILLGIPLPSLFVAQTEKGIWELVDGLQRVCTLLELQGLLKDDEGTTRPPLQLIGTKFLPALDGKRWDSGDPKTSLTQAQRLDIKRAKVDVKIIKRESSKSSKYDLFQRLNSYGSQLTAQELRSCILVNTNKDFFNWIKTLSNHESFVNTTALSERLIEEQYDIELVLRFLVLHQAATNFLKPFSNFSQYLDDSAIELAESSDAPSRKKLEATFKKTFDTIEENGEEHVFKKYNGKKKVFQGPFLNTAFEIFAMGLGYHIALETPFKTDLLSVAKKVWSSEELGSGFATGLSTENRLAITLPLGRKMLLSKTPA